jgi:tRNA1Val (adenine37-N6)-methyltransferase
MPFRFKQFSVEDDRSTMKVGTDAVLLGTWTETRNCERILDVGTGSGVVALMLAQRSKAMIDGIDLDPDSITQATQNGERSPWSGRLRFILSKLQDYPSNTQGSFDLIVTNPPFFSNALKSPSSKKNLARHARKKEHEEWITHILKLLTPGGKLAIILPANEWDDFRAKAIGLGLHCSRTLKVRTKNGKPESRILSEWSKLRTVTNEEELSIMDERGNFTNHFKQLTKDFYLNF